MRFNIFTTVLALATSALAQTPDFNSINVPSVVKAGGATKITWTAPTHKDDQVKIELIGGADQNSLVPKAVLAGSIKNSDLGWAWAINSALGTDALYGIKISLVSDSTVYQYSNPFTITPAAAASSGSASASGSATSASVTVTVNLSAASTSTTVTSIVSSSTVSSTTVASATTSVSTPLGSLSSTASASKTTLSTTASATGSAATTSASATSSVSRAAGAQATAGAVAMLGGLAVAMMAL